MQIWRLEIHEKRGWKVLKVCVSLCFCWTTSESDLALRIKFVENNYVLDCRDTRHLNVSFIPSV